MTVKVKLINTGNHKDDRVAVNGPGLAGKELVRGESVLLHPGEDYRFTEVRHGGDTSCREHNVMAVMSEGPGAALVRSRFNPSESSAVLRLKTLAAALINEIDALPAGTTEAHRLKAIAKTEVEGASHWAVKAATAPNPPESG